MRIVFMGTPEFAVPSLERLIDEHEVRAVVTQPDRPRGRGQKLTPTPVKQAACRRKITVLTPEKLNDSFIQKLDALDPEALVIVAYGQLIPEQLLNRYTYGCINLHASLLPRYRGASPIHRAIMNGETETGLTTMFINEDWDAGDMLLKEKMEIGDEETVGSLHDRMKVRGAELLSRTLDKVEAGEYSRIPQKDEEATFAPRITREEARIDWRKDGEEIKNLVRGTNPYPGAYTFFGGERLKVHRVEDLPKLCVVLREMAADHLPAEPGTVVICSENDGIVVRAGEGFVRLLTVQPASRPKMDACEFVCGYPVVSGMVLDASFEGR